MPNVNYVVEIPSQDADILRNILTFLMENEQYGDDWSEEILVIENILQQCPFVGVI